MCGLALFRPRAILTRSGIGGFSRGYTANAAAIPGYVAQFLLAVSIAFSSDRTGERGLHVAFGAVWTAIGLFCALSTSGVAESDRDRAPAGECFALRALRWRSLDPGGRRRNDHIAGGRMAQQLSPFESAAARPGRSSHVHQLYRCVDAVSATLTLFRRLHPGAWPWTARSNAAIDPDVPGIGRAPLPLAAAHVRRHLGPSRSLVCPLSLQLGAAAIAILLKLTYIRYPSRQQRAQAARAPVAESVAGSDDGLKTPVEESKA